MADAIISSVAEQLMLIAKEHIKSEIQLVRGVEKELLNLSNNLKEVRNELDDAERRRYDDKAISDWVLSLEQTSYEMEDVLEEWSYALVQHMVEIGAANLNKKQKQKVSPSLLLPSCLCFRNVVFRHDIAVKVENLKAKLDDILNEKSKFHFTAVSEFHISRVQSTSRIDSSELQGRTCDTDSVVKVVLGFRGELGLRIISIVGAGGIGKTTLAQLAYRDARLIDCFDLKSWVCVSNSFDAARIAQDIFESMGKGRMTSISNQLDATLERLVELIAGKRFLLVLDDVWTEDYEKWEPLKNALKSGGASTTVLVTTRNENVAIIMGTMEQNIYSLGLLPEADCRLLLEHIALSGRSMKGFEDVCKKIARRCSGLPLAAKTLGSLLRFKDTLEEWENVYMSRVWEFKEVKAKLFPHLLLSYNELSPMHKRCFSYCAFFPKDEKIRVEEVIRLWMALGYLGSSAENDGDKLELIGQECFKTLSSRSLFEDRQTDSFKLHDIVHEFAQFLRNASNRMEDSEIKTPCQVCCPFIAQVKAYRSLMFDKRSTIPTLCNCLTSLRVLGLWNYFPMGIENLIHLKWLSIDQCVVHIENMDNICKLYYLQTLFLRSCNLVMIPREIRNLIKLRHLDLSNNKELLKLPESLCELPQLRTLNVEGCVELSNLPQGVDRLKNLKHLHNMYSVMQLPESLAKLTGLRRLSEFNGGSGGSRMGLLKKLNLLSGSLQLKITLGKDGVVEDAREAELKLKRHIESLRVEFLTESGIPSSMIHMAEGVMDALEPHQNLRHLSIFFYDGTKFPDWISSPLNQLRSVSLTSFRNTPCLPPLGKLPCLEEIDVRDMYRLVVLGPQLWGLGDAASSPNNVIFPKLKKLIFKGCENWREWEDITTAHEECSIMPCLTELAIRFCSELTALPHCLIGKASSLELLDISGSGLLIERYGDINASAWTLISQNNPHLRLRM
ncbi:putative disease resistance protein RGA3 [Salvia hispanica]|uniref:putative disease resistance protein RGA3 n=1 Tax=Salvia hispanica TaxID=49212 RepID=UPI00200920FD|nr:putative disease resistance protein RGA3 [Salvia hispanica]XP_047952893.1 putative disease resistance protein RGA3 [Salvia hispanica]